ncbi:MAG TPA: hypothetical protein VIH47_01065 [Solirubrobacterales bacterium]
MFDSKKNLTVRLTDAADLLIDFATLGEYGLEPVGKATATCESRHRQPVSPAPIRQRRRPGAPTLILASEEPRSRRRHQIDGPFLLRP